MIDNECKAYIVDLIPQYKKFFPNMDYRTRFINEHGLYKLISRSNMSFAKKFQIWLYNTVLPSIRRTGKYVSDPKDKQLISDLNNKIHKYKKTIKAYEHDRKKYNFPDGGYVYITQPLTNDPLIKKIGKSNNKIYNRLSTLNSAVPHKNKVIYALAVGNPTAVEHCIKAYLYDYKFIFSENKEYYKCPTKTMINIFNNCAYLISNNIFCFDCPYPIINLPKPINHKTIVWDKNNIVDNNVFHPYVDKKQISRHYYLVQSDDYFDDSDDSDDSENMYSYH